MTKIAFLNPEGYRLTHDNITKTTEFMNHVFCDLKLTDFKITTEMYDIILKSFQYLLHIGYTIYLSTLFIGDTLSYLYQNMSISTV